MNLRYSYNSEYNANPRHRWIHFLLYVGALLLLLVGFQQLFLFFTDWSASEDEQEWWRSLLGAGYLIAGLAMAYIGYRHQVSNRSPAERYVRVTDEALIWSLTQKTDEKQLALADIAAVERPNIRDLKLTLKDGNTKVLPLYLVNNEEKQEELLQVLRAI